MAKTAVNAHKEAALLLRLRCLRIIQSHGKAPGLDEALWYTGWTIEGDSGAGSAGHRADSHLTTVWPYMVKCSLVSRAVHKIIPFFECGEGWILVSWSCEECFGGGRICVCGVWWRYMDI